MSERLKQARREITRAEHHANEVMRQEYPIGCRVAFERGRGRGQGEVIQHGRVGLQLEILSDTGKRYWTDSFFLTERLS